MKITVFYLQILKNTTKTSILTLLTNYK